MASKAQRRPGGEQAGQKIQW